MKVLLSKDEFRYRLKECDGICSNCQSWSMANADPNAENVFCSECENRSVCGMNVAKTKGIIEVY